MDTAAPNSSLSVDPWDWSVEQVVAYLCRTSTWTDPLLCPDPVFFGNSLRENLINGKVLLTKVDKAALKEDLGLKAFGTRSAVLEAIQGLREKSIKYANESKLLSFIPYSKH
jgi:hypothetical protein